MSRSDESDLFEGLRLKDAGIARVNSHNVVWKEYATGRLLEYRKIIGVNKPFTIEDFKDWAQLTRPKHFNAFGGFWNSAAKAEIIQWTGNFSNSRYKVAHATPIKVWIFPG